MLWDSVLSLNQHCDPPPDAGCCWQQCCCQASPHAVCLIAHGPHHQTSERPVSVCCMTLASGCSALATAYLPCGHIEAGSDGYSSCWQHRSPSVRTCSVQILHTSSAVCSPDPLLQYEADSAPALALNASIERTEKRFATYAKQGLLCGTDGLPHLISDPGLAIRYGHTGETLVSSGSSVLKLCIRDPVFAVAAPWQRSAAAFIAECCSCASCGWTTSGPSA